ncbi:MAG: nickel-dependent lactate racemase [Bryobacteraceae bacterium]|nr:nickel-dependent lactate racemase [Bryobacteraceae bacterium]
MRVQLAFGKTGLPLELPEGYDYQVLETRSASPLENPAQALEEALDAPIGGPPLAELAKGKRSAAISVCDITRPTPNSFVLPSVIRRLESAGIAREQITILIGTGLHRPATDEEILEILGPELASQYRVVNHFARDLGSHRFLGQTAAGTPAYVDERFVAADLHITAGLIEPHFMLGFSGGRKLIAPALAARETIAVLHSPKFMRDGRSVEGSIEDNPLHRELLEIARMARHDFMVDVAITRNREVAGVFAGNPVEAHRTGAQFVSRAMLQQLDEPVDAVITTSAGYPLDLTYYQAIKGVSAAQHVLKPGGTILLLAACGEGAGAPEFRRMLKDFDSHEGFLSHIDRAPVEIDQWQLEKLALVARKAKLLFYVPGLPSEYYSSLWGATCASAEEARDALLSGLRPGARVAIVPEGPYVLAKALATAA